jgi:two-component system chemotaxis response regulator CheB
MAVRVLVVDDSGFFRRRVTEMLEADPGIKVIGTASNGREAIEQAKSLKPDVITMDIEMPELDGISATRQIMQQSPTRIIMFSSLTTEGARSTLDALDAGALDFLPKRFEDISSDRDEAKKLLCERVKQLSHQRVNTAAAVIPRTASVVRPAAVTSTAKPVVAHKVEPVHAGKGDIKLVAIGTSTGGPVALQEVLSKLPAAFPVPILMVQHMPASFTPAFAQRLNDQCEITVSEAKNGDVLQAGHAYLAPGGKQMLLKKHGADVVINIIDSDPALTYKPSVDMTFSSIAKIYPSQTLAIILTGMGADGREGSKELHRGGSKIWAQDEHSCVVYGMPAAVTEAGITERVLDIKDVGPSIARRV